MAFLFHCPLINISKCLKVSVQLVPLLRNGRRSRTRIFLISKLFVWYVVRQCGSAVAVFILYCPHASIDATKVGFSVVVSHLLMCIIAVLQTNIYGTIFCLHLQDVITQPTWLGVIEGLYAAHPSGTTGLSG